MLYPLRWGGGGSGFASRTSDTRLAKQEDWLSMVLLREMMAISACSSQVVMRERALCMADSICLTLGSAPWV